MGLDRFILPDIRERMRKGPHNDDAVQMAVNGVLAAISAAIVWKGLHS